MMDDAFCGPAYASLVETLEVTREVTLGTIAVATCTDIHKPDNLATIDVAPDSQIHPQMISLLDMPGLNLADLDVGQSILPRDSHP